MLGNFFKRRASEPESRDYIAKILGTGAANPTTVYGNGLTITWVSTGLYRYTFKDNPLNWIGVLGFSFEATTPAALKGYTIVATPYDSTNKRVDISVYNSSFALADLAALQWLAVTLGFKETKV